MQGELENEAALEDMHMFFVAFNKRQKRIVETVEEEVKGDKNEGAAGEDNCQCNVTVLSKEIDIEWEEIRNLQAIIF